MSGRLRMNALLGGFLTGMMLAVVLVGLFWTPMDPLQISFSARLAPPSADHLLGADEFGRDIASRLMRGAATTFSIAAAAVTFAVVFGTLIGLVSGFAGGLVDRVIMSVNDALMAFPGILLAMGLITVFGGGRYGIIAALGLAYTPTMARVVRGNVMTVRSLDFVDASWLMGNGVSYTVARHVLPNCIAPIIVLATSMFGWAILAESALSFLGLGVAPPEPTWGNMLSDARPYFSQYPRLALLPGLCISIALLGINLLGDALRDRLDPRMKDSR